MDAATSRKRKLGHSLGSTDESSGSDESDESSSDGVSRPTPGYKRTKTIRPRAASIAPGEAYSSDIFQLQVQELLEDIRPKYDRTLARVESVLRKLKHTIESIPPRDALPIPDAEQLLRSESRTAIPFPEPRPAADAKYTVAYAVPADINVTGSFVLRTAVESDAAHLVDIAVTMPSGIFQHKDYLNYRYFYKRAYYLACIASGISKDPECQFDLRYDYQNANFLQPTLLVSPVKGTGEDDFTSSKCRIRILLAVENSVFSIDKTLPWKNCLRHRTNESSDTVSDSTPTPLYNATIRSEASVGTYLKLLYATSTKSESFKDACMLGTVWLRQRGFGTDLYRGGFGSFEVAVLIALLLQGGGTRGNPLLLKASSSYQLLKILLKFLASRDLVKDPLFINYRLTGDSKTEKSTIPLLFDGTTGLNVLFKMSLSSYKKLQHDARMTIRLLNSSVVDRFSPSFISKCDDSLLEFDSVCRISLPTNWRPPAIHPDAMDRATKFCNKIYVVLATALGDRATLIYPHLDGPDAWSTKSSNPLSKGDPVVSIGMLVNSEHSARAVDHGPPAEKKEEAAAFRKFWGEKAELRRFKDGSILETLIWSDKNNGQSILEQIARHAFGRHLSPEVADSVKFHLGDLQRMLPLGTESKAGSIAAPEDRRQAFETLEKHIRNLEGLPLQVRQIIASGDGLDIIIQFESAASWPDDLKAIQMTKIAFLYKLGDLLEEVPGITTRVGLENENWDLGLRNTPFLDIVFGNLCFRLHILHDRELTLLERLLKDTAHSPRSREDTALAIAAQKRTFINSPAHTQMFRTLSTRHPLLSQTARLLKEWCSRHLLSLYFAPELLELIALYTFTNHYPWSTPGSITSAFFRTLYFISKWDWRNEPLVVDTNSDVTRAEMEVINLRFQAWRKIDPAMNRRALFVATKNDLEGTAWTGSGPSKMVTARIQALATAAIHLVKEQALDLDVKSLFTPSFAEYDFILHVSLPSSGGAKVAAKKSAFKNIQLGNSREDQAMRGFEPVRLYVAELQKIHGSTVVLFWGGEDSPAIGGLWIPWNKERPFKVGLGYSSMPVAGEYDEAVVAVNRTAILNDMARLGGDLLVKVEVVEKKAAVRGPLPSTE